MCVVPCAKYLYVCPEYRLPMYDVHGVLVHGPYHRTDQALSLLMPLIELMYERSPHYSLLLYAV